MTDWTVFASAIEKWGGNMTIIEYESSTVKKVNRMRTSGKTPVCQQYACEDSEARCSSYAAGNVRSLSGLSAANLERRDVYARTSSGSRNGD